MSRIAFVINPVSGAHKAMSVWRKIEASGMLGELEHEVHFTGWPGHASLLTRQAMEEGIQKIIVVGGDGTLNECLNGYMLCDEKLRKNAVVGMIPHGTGSDWAKHHGISGNTLEALKFCLEAEPVLHDVGEVIFKRLGSMRSRYFMNISTCCFGAVAAETANVYKSRGKGGKLVYIKAVLKHLFSYKSKTISINFDGKEITEKSFLIATGICSSNGAGLKLCPGAISNDGYFYVTHVGDISVWEVLKNIFGLFNGNFIRHPKVNIHKVQHLIISTDNNDIDMEVDGEYLGKGDFEYRMHPGKLRVLAEK